MEIELSEIVDFFSKYPPLTALTQAQVIDCVNKTEIRYFSKDTKQESNAADKDLWLVRSGAIEITKDDDLVEIYHEGSAHHHDLVDMKNYQIHFIEDTLVYIIKAEAIAQYQQENKEFKAYFIQDIEQHVHELIQETLEKTVHADVYSNQEDTGTLPASKDNDYVSQLGVTVEDFAYRPAVKLRANDSIKHAARLMTEQNASAIVMVDDSAKLLGVVTDSDIRSRAILNGLPMSSAVEKIASVNIQTINNKNTLFEAMILMTRFDINHLPVVDDNNFPLGIISSIDILNQQNMNSNSIAHKINTVTTVEEMIIEANNLPRLQLQMTHSGLSAEQVNKAFTLVGDEVFRKTIAFAKEKFGPAPVSYAWFVVGSQARGEMVASSDQDNCLLISNDATAEDMQYFEQISHFVCDTLNDASFVYCDGNVMAKNEKWRQNEATWKRYYDEWIGHNSPHILMHAVVFFDMRLIDGDKALFERMSNYVSLRSKNSPEFLGRIAANALKMKPPLGFFRQFVLEQDGKQKELLDLKFKGLVPLNHMAQVLSLAYGLKEQNSLSRLRKIAKENCFDNQINKDLIAAWEFLAYQRYQLQAEQIKNGLSPNNKVSPKNLSSLERKYLKDVFTAIKDAQEHFANRYRDGRFDIKKKKAKFL